jgi:sigma-E factor negative regulatory protein RseA
MEGDMEKLSALMDGELAQDEAELALAALAGAEAQASWRAWQAIGAALREGAEPAPGFAERLAARLDAETTPAIEALP